MSDLFSQKEYKNIAINIGVFRAEKGWTLRDLSNACGISTTSLSYIENGVKKARISTLKKIADALETTIANLKK